MGMFKNLKESMGQASAAMDQAQQAQQQYGGMADSGQMGGMAGMASAQGSLQGQAQEQNRILTIGQPASALIKGHVDTGENVAGNPVWIFDLEVTPEGGQPYSVQHREIVSTMALGSYPDGTSMACRVDPADPQKIAFGEKPFM